MPLVGGVYLTADIQLISQSFVVLILTAALGDHYHCHLQGTQGTRPFKIKNLVQQI